MGWAPGFLFLHEPCGPRERLSGRDYRRPAPWAGALIFIRPTSFLVTATLCGSHTLCLD